MNQSIRTLQYQKMLPKFDELDANSFIWLPLENVPIDEHYPADSMHQPVLSAFELLTWSAIAPFATDDQKFMRELALKHQEMGYFLIHYQDIFGIIGVEHEGSELGRAVIFNAAKNKFHVDQPTMLKLLYSKLKYPCNSFLYSPGEFSNYTTIPDVSYYGPACDD